MPQQTLSLRTTQTLSMTPQLQQAIRLLQLSTVELQQEIDNALESNPLLEVEDQKPDSEADPSELGAESFDEKIEKAMESEKEPAPEITEASASDQAMDTDRIPDDSESPLDTTWESTYDEGATKAHHTSSSLVDDEEFESEGHTEETLKEHLIWQLTLSPFTERDEAIARAVIDGIDDNGYLKQSDDDIAEAAAKILVEKSEEKTGKLLSNEEYRSAIVSTDIEPDEIAVVLKRIRHFDPIGAGSRTVEECLLAQLREIPDPGKAVGDAERILSGYSDLLAQKDIRTLLRKTGLSDEEFRDALAVLKTLDPHPGSAFEHDRSQYVDPDVIVRKVNGVWQAFLNPALTRKLGINQRYAKIAKSGTTNERQYVRNNLQEAKWIIKSLETRNDTLLKVARCIVEKQRDFFEGGAEEMKPMILSEIADSIEMHESTISRVTTQKYMLTPHGIYELKFFFSSHVSTNSGGECSSTAIRAKIKKIIESENRAKPLSDSAIAKMLCDTGIMVARRTVAKYRESLSIPSSSQRKEIC